MYQYIWDADTGGLLLTSEISKFSKEPRPVYYRELDILGFDKYWTYPKDDSAPLMWAEANNYIYRGRTVARVKGGSLYTPPELILLEEPEPEGESLQFVDVEAMCRKNKGLMEALEQETIKKVYNTYRKYKNKVDIFHVSFSGGKDSVVNLDIVQRAIPHNDFVVLFGDTGMEFPDTYSVIDNTKKECESKGVPFYIAKADTNPLDNWRKFGPPSSTARWCCSVHKTTPQLLFLRRILGSDDIREMAFVGVRAEESTRRSGYSFVSLSSKQKGQYSCNPILEWSSAEVYLYIYIHNLSLNKAYTKGSSRAGCLLCPMATNKSDYINRSLYEKEVEPYINVIKELYLPGENNPDLTYSYLNNKGWKARKNGRDLIIGCGNMSDRIDSSNKYIVSIEGNSELWTEWIKTVGVLDYSDGHYKLFCGESITISFDVDRIENKRTNFIFQYNEYKGMPTLFKYIKNALKKSMCCVTCRHCEVNCPYGNISFINGNVRIADSCIHCNLCNNIEDGCLVYNSLILPKGTGTMRKGSIDEYGTHPLKMEWMREFVQYKDMFESNHSLGKVMVPMFYKYLRNSGVLNNNNSRNKLTDILFRDGLNEEYIWALMMVNLSYSSQVGWLVDNLSFDTPYSRSELCEMVSEVLRTKTGPKNVPKAYYHMANTPLSGVGFGKAVDLSKSDFSITRTPWENPVPEVILYSLYKFAEACGGIYQFTLHDLMDDTVERDGISPTRIFGLDELTMAHMVNGLSVNYPDFINASFTLDLDKITLRRDKTSADVLQLF